MSGTPKYPGPVKYQFNKRLAGDWRHLAIYLEIDEADQNAFTSGFEPNNIWEWLDSKNRLTELPGALRDIGHEDMADLLDRYRPDTPLPVDPNPPPTLSAQRPELAVLMQTGRDHWLITPGNTYRQQHHLELPGDDILFRYGPTGEDLFQQLFGKDPEFIGNLFRIVYATDAPAEPTLKPLRLHLLSDDARMYNLPWHTLRYQGRSLCELGWTIELQVMQTPAQPEFPHHSDHFCIFPAQLILAGSDSGQNDHFNDLDRFFQHYWQENPNAAALNNADSLHAVLKTGSPRLVYYCGSASTDGLVFSTDDVLPWPELGELIASTNSVSLLMLNLFDADDTVIAQGQTLLNGVKAAVLFQINLTQNQHNAAKASMHWLAEVFNQQSDPLQALYQHHHGNIAAWSRYSRWHMNAPSQLHNPELINLLLDRQAQRDALQGAKQQFYIDSRRRIHHVVAYGVPGSRTHEFPNTAKQHLVSNKHQQEIYFLQSIKIPADCEEQQEVDDLVREQLGLKQEQPVLDKLIRPEAGAGDGYCFIVLGWQVECEDIDIDSSRSIIRAISDWCRQQLSRDITSHAGQRNIRMISVIALESLAGQDWAAALKAEIDEFIDEYASDPVFHFGELERLSAVRKRDLYNYFRNDQICTYTGRHRDEFPDLILAERSEMPFDEAVSVLRRGDPHNWDNLYDELQQLTEQKRWPPDTYSPDFWETLDEQ